MTCETLLVRHLTRLICLLLVALATFVTTTEAAWPKFLDATALLA